LSIEIYSDTHLEYHNSQDKYFYKYLSAPGSKERKGNLCGVCEAASPQLLQTDPQADTVNRRTPQEHGKAGLCHTSNSCLRYRSSTKHSHFRST